MDPSKKTGKDDGADDPIQNEAKNIYGDGGTRADDAGGLAGGPGDALGGVGGDNGGLTGVGGNDALASAGDVGGGFGGGGIGGGDVGGGFGGGDVGGGGGGAVEA